MTVTPNDVLAPHPESLPIYSSPTVHERRQRILKEARKMIGHSGIEGFSIRTLGKQAGVCQRTIYNAFQNRDRIITLAVHGAFDDANRHLHYRTAPDTLEGIVDRLISMNSHNLRARNYTRTVASIYFSSAVHPDIWQALRGMATDNLLRWLHRLSLDGQLQDWVDIEEAAGDLVNIEYSKINEWAQGHVTDDQYVRKLVTSVLSFAVGVTRGDCNGVAQAMLRDIRRTGEVPNFPKPVFVPSAQANTEATPCFASLSPYSG